MPAADLEDGLTASRSVVLILRLVLDRGGRIRFGAILDAKAEPLDRFASERELLQALRDWCQQQRHAAETNGASGPDHVA